MRKNGWTEEENDVMREFYARGRFEVLAKMLPRRTPGSMRKQAIVLGLSREYVSDETPYWPTPAMDLAEQRACVRFRKWRGPVNDGPLIWSIRNV